MQVIHDLRGEPAYWCPVCGCPHRVSAKIWKWNGSYTKPTFTPSIRWYTTRPDGKNQWALERPGKLGTLRWGTEAEALAARPNYKWTPKLIVAKDRERTLCHVHIRDGNVQILADSQRLGGQTLPLQEWDPEKWR